MVCTCASRGNKVAKGKRKTTHQPPKGQQAGKMKEGGKWGPCPTTCRARKQSPSHPHARAIGQATQSGQNTATP
eukprot:151543-Chlamydomonas_euryale.AAC.1